jgi:mRNA deadenylase 3'-5' endonuclease subunit Ccr4
LQGTDPVSSKFPHDGLVRQVDYIWYASGSLDVVGVAETAPETNIQEGIPNAIYPSDHVSTKAMLSFKG